MIAELMAFFDAHEGVYFSREELIKKFGVNQSRLTRGLKHVLHYKGYEALVVRHSLKGYHVCRYGKKKTI